MKLERIIEELEKENEEVTTNKKLVLKALKHDGFLLEYVDESLTNDKEVVLTAVKQYGDSLMFASESLRNDAKFMLEILKIHSNTLFSVTESLRNDAKFMLEAIKINADSAKFMGDSLKKDRKFILAAVKISFDFIAFAHSSLFDKQFFIDCLKAMKNFKIDGIVYKKAGIAQKDVSIKIKYKLFIFTISSISNCDKSAMVKHMNLIESALYDYTKQYVDFSQTIAKIPLHIDIKSNIVSYMQRSSFFKNTTSKNSIYKHLSMAEASAKKIRLERNKL